MDRNQVSSTLHGLAETFLEESFDTSDDAKARSALHIILSNSVQAIHFVTLIESEFEIEFDDEEIDFDFFLSFDHITELVCKHLQDHNPVPDNGDGSY